MIVTRFAPSPNGSLHLGHAFAAITAHDLARDAEQAGTGGRFLVRIEDIDGPRSREEFVAEHLADLAWLGLEWDGVPVRQSDRLVRYAEAAGQLRAMGLLYPCVCTRAEIIAAAERTGQDGPVYPGTCRGRTIADEAAAWRLDLAKALQLTGPLTWRDALAGEQAADPLALGDPVLVRKDLPASYHLAATLDDAADGVTLVTRGRDLFAATHIHRLIIALLALPVPLWHHHPVLVDDATGSKLAKRRGSPSLADRRRAGEDGAGIAAALRDRRLPAGISLGNA